MSQAFSLGWPTTQEGQPQPLSRRQWDVPFLTYCPLHGRPSLSP